MILPFSQQLNGKPTYFPEKILLGIDCHLGEYPTEKYKKELLSRRGRNSMEIVNYNSKIHTIRDDKTKRWKAGNKIHFVINNRQPDYYQFAPVLTCVSTQTIIIKWRLSNATGRYTLPYVMIDGKTIRGKALDRLAANDGFASRNGFLEYFNADFTGKIIHWTNMKY